MLPSPTAATSFWKSGVDAIARQFLGPVPLFATQEAPLSVDMYIDTPGTVAAILRKSGEAVTPYFSPAGPEMKAVLDGYDPAGTCTHAELPIALL